MAKSILWAVLSEPLPIQPRFEIMKGHHITLVYSAEVEQYFAWVGKVFEATVTAEAWNNRIQAVRVKLPDGIPCTSVTPHITVSRISEAESLESNVMLLKPLQEVPVSFTVIARIEFRDIVTG